MVYPAGNDGDGRNEQHAVLVFDEGSASTVTFFRDSPSVHTSRSALAQAARAYFEEYPDPRPWHRAEHGSGWVLTFEEHELLGIKAGEVFITQTGEYALEDPRIKDARLIYE